MATTEATVAYLNQLKIANISEDWVKEIWHQDFTECDVVPVDLEEELQDNAYHIKTLVALRKTLRPWANGQDEETGEGLWSVLVENDLPYKSLVAMLYHLMYQGQKRVSNAVHKEAGLVAASVYFTLLEIPGSRAFKVFHPMLFDKAMHGFKLWSQLGAPKRKRKSSPLRSSQGGRKNKAAKRSRDTQPAEEDLFARAESEEENEDGDDGGLLSQQDVHKLSRSLLEMLRSLVKMLSRYSLKECDQGAYATVQTLAELSRLEPETLHGGSDFDENTDADRLKTVGELAFKGLLLLSSSMHGEVTAMITAVFKHLLPSLLMLIEEKGVAAQTIPQPIVLVKDWAVRFVGHLLKTQPAASLPALRILMQHMCTKVADKADYRGKVAQAIVTIMRDMPAVNYAHFLEWLFKYSRNAKVGYRGFALDVVSLLLNEPERSDENVPPEHAVFLTHKFLIQMLLSRCSDVAPTVRSRAITGFAQCMVSSTPDIVTAVKNIMTPKVTGRPPLTRIVQTPNAHQRSETESEQGSVAKEQTIEMASTAQAPTADAANHDGAAVLTPGDKNRPRPGGSPMTTIQLTPGVEITLADGKGVVSMMRRRAADDKVNVRKAAIQALETVILNLDCTEFDPQDLDVIHERCLDPALSVRKQCLLSLTNMLRERPHNSKIQSAWLDGVLPMVMDRETGAQEKCLEIVEEVLLQGFTHGARRRSREGDEQLTWDLLNIMASGEQVELRRFLQRACQHWGRQGKLKPSMIGSLRSHVNTGNNAGAWMFLAEMAPFVPKFDTGFILDYWQEHMRHAPEAAEQGTMGRVLTVISHIAKTLKQDQSAELSADLRDRLMRFDSPPELISATVTALNKLCQTKDGGAAKQMANEWFIELLKASDSYLSQVILNESPENELDEDRIIRHLFTLGEIAQLRPDKTPKRVFLLVQSLIAAPVITSADGSSQPSLAPSDDSGHSAPSQSITCSRSSQSSQPSSQLSEGSQPYSQVLSQFSSSKMSGRVRAFAFMTLGKLCLQNPDLAKKCVAALARELETCVDATVRNNVVIIMCDLCVRYTTLVDRYVPNISACLKDDSALIRKQTLTLLTHLLQEDYLKWKGSLFYRFITVLVDDNKEIRDFAEFCLVHLLMQRHPAMFFHHFVECVFHFNCYSDHAMFNKFGQTDREKRMFSLQGQKNFQKRTKIYKFLLEHMTDEQRFQLTAKLCQEVLAAIVDGVIPLNADTSALLQDALTILSCKEIKLSSMRARPQDEIAETEQEMAAIVMNAAKKTFITQVLKKNVIENIVPIVVSLKHMLEKHRSPVLKDLMMYLRELMKDYKNEVKDILSVDKQLANEIEFDLRKFEEQQQEEEDRRLHRLRGMTTPSPRSSPVQRSPQQVGGASPAASPQMARTPSPASRAQVGGSPAVWPGLQTPRSAPPVLNILGTPARSVPLSTVAIMNSARKALEHAKHLRETRQGDTPQKGKKVAWSDQNTGTDSPSGKKPAGNAGKQLEPKTPEKKRVQPERVSRAISTPSANITFGNITFLQGDQNLSMIPPSPIPSALPIRLYPQTRAGSASPSWTTRTEEDEDGTRRQVDVIHMFSPEKPAPKPRVWNVKSAPSPLTTEVGKEKEPADDGSGAMDSSPAGESPAVDAAAPPGGRRKARRGKAKPETTSGQATVNAAPRKPSSRKPSSQRLKVAAFVNPMDSSADEASVFVSLVERPKVKEEVTDAAVDTSRDNSIAGRTRARRGTKDDSGGTRKSSAAGTTSDESFGSQTRRSSRSKKK